MIPWVQHGFSCLYLPIQTWVHMIWCRWKSSREGKHTNMSIALSSMKYICEAFSFLVLFFNSQGDCGLTLLTRVRRHWILPVGQTDERHTQTSYSLVTRTQTRPRLPRVILESITSMYGFIMDAFSTQFACFFQPTDSCQCCLPFIAWLILLSNLGTTAWL